MRIDVLDQGSKTSEALRNYVGLRLMSVLDHLVRQVSGVAVNLTDVHSPDGDVGKRCRMLALLAPSGQASVEGTDPGLYGAIDRAAEELAHAVALELAQRGVRRRAGAVDAAFGPASTMPRE